MAGARRSACQAGRWTLLLLVTLGVLCLAQSCHGLPQHALTGVKDVAKAQQPRLRRPYARGVMSAPAATPGADQDGGKHAPPNLAAILVGAFLGVAALCTVAACIIVRLCIRITGPALPRPTAAEVVAAAAAATPAPVDLPIIIGQHVIQPDGTMAGAFESSSSSEDDGSSSASEEVEEEPPQPRRPSQECCTNTQEVPAAAHDERASGHASDTIASSDCGCSNCCYATAICSSTHICVDITGAKGLPAANAAKPVSAGDGSTSDELPFSAGDPEAAAVAEESDAACAC